MRDLYEVLGVSRAATPDDLKKAYRTLAKLYHPDKCPDDQAAEEKFKEAANAYQVLSDPQQRVTYDRYGFDGLRRGGGGSSGDDGGMGYGGGFRNVEDIFSAFGDMFGDFFSPSRGHGVARGQDLRLDLDLSFHEAVWGGKKDVKLTRPAACSTCKGHGSANGHKIETCRTCAGRGQVTHAQGFFRVQSTCAECRGSGKLVKDPCLDCQGRGVRTETSIQTLTVPPGVDDGQSLRVTGKGETATGGTSGDLYVVLHVTSDPRFKRDGNDVTSVVPISFVKAALGGEIEIDTLDAGCEGTAILEMAPGTQPGETILRRGQGIPHHDRSGRGDHYVEFRIEVPRNLTSHQEKLLREFGDALDEGPKRTRRKRA